MCAALSMFQTVEVMACYCLWDTPKTACCLHKVFSGNIWQFKLFPSSLLIMSTFLSNILLFLFMFSDYKFEIRVEKMNRDEEHDTIRSHARCVAKM